MRVPDDDKGWVEQEVQRLGRMYADEDESEEIATTIYALSPIQLRP